MSSRDRARRRASPRAPDYVARPGSRGPAGEPVEAPWSQAEPLPGIAPLALVPLRIFLGVTFLYAGLDKLLAPAFLSASGPGSIGAQMVAFAHTSPLGPLVVAVGEPFPIAVGFGISIAEIAVGVGALSGLLFRASAALGAALALLFWLTASWAIKPYYYGPDLPYAVGWITLGLAGTGGMWTMRAWVSALGPEPSPRETQQRRFAASRGRPLPEPGEDITRRVVLEAGLIGGVAVLLASVTGVVGLLTRGRSQGHDGLGSAASTASRGSAAGAPTPAQEAPAPAASADAGTGTVVADTPPPTGPVIGTLDRLSHGGPLAFDDPTTGDPSAVLLLASGKVVAFDLTCTHAGCTVEYDPSSRFLICPCHGATFDPAHGARAIAGPTDQPLTGLPIHIDQTTGEITLIS